MLSNTSFEQLVAAIAQLESKSYQQILIINRQSEIIDLQTTAINRLLEHVRGMLQELGGLGGAVVVLQAKQEELSRNFQILHFAVKAVLDPIEPSPAAAAMRKEEHPSGLSEASAIAEGTLRTASIFKLTSSSSKSGPSSSGDPSI